MEHFQVEKKEQKKLSNGEWVSAAEFKKALSEIKHECFFEYDMANDSFWLTREFELTETNGVKISGFKDKLHHYERIHEADVDTVLAFLSEGSRQKCEFRYIKEDGSVIWCMAIATVICDQNGTPKSLIGRIADNDEEKHLRDLLVEQALLDPLTKLYCKVKAQNMIENYLRNEGSFGKHALILINIKEFREINRRFGDFFGDNVLVAVAERLKKVFRKKDIISRIGGDDFLILLKDVSSIDVIKKKVLEISQEIKCVYAGENLSVSCEIGVSRFPCDGRNFNPLFRHADYAMYRVSRSGDMNYEIYDPSCAGDEYAKSGEFYHEYVVKEKKKNSYGDFRREITDFAVDVMLESKDVASAIKMILDKVGRYYCCDNVMVLEVDDHDILHTTYSWNIKDGLNFYNAMQFLDLKDIPSFEECFDERGLRVFSNTNVMKKHPGYAPFIEMLNVKSALLCAFYDENEVKGCICVGHEKKTRDWLKEEMETLITVTKIISVYLLKLRASEKVKNRVEYLKNYDSLTKLPTQPKFKKDVEEQLASHQNEPYAIVCMDINKFKYINDTIGYEAGDNLLKEISKIVSAQSYDIVLMGRVSADNFLLLMTYINEEQVVSNLKRLNQEFMNKIKYCNMGENSYLVSGICMIKDGDDVMKAIENANIARKKVKKNPDKRYCFYDQDLENEIQLEMTITNNMQQALENDEFKMYLQPKISLKDNKIVGAEALTRWIKKDGTLMIPDQFIPLFEKNGFIITLDFYIYECACKTIRKWMDDKIEPVTISVNVSRVHLNTDGFVDKVLRLVEKYEIPHKYFEFELTESIFLDNTEIALSTMRRLREEDFFVSIDDFGAGYSSLNLLKDMATDVLKLDKEFFRKGEMQKEEKIIVSSITNMAKQLEMKVLSEGVETEAQSDFLKEIACDMAQGYLYAKPMPEAEFTQMLKENR